MGFLSSLFGLGSSRAQPATSTVVQAQKLPSEIAPFVEEVVGEAQELYKQRLGEGYVPFTGETIAPFTPQEETAMANIEGLVGTSRPLQEEALGVTRGLAEKFTPETAEEYMSPYQRAVTDIEKREAQRRFDREIRPRFEASAVQAGGLSGLGSRAGVESAELERGQAQLLADIETKGLQSAFRDAQQQFAQQKQREAGMATQLGKAGPAMFASGLQEAGALQTVGEQRRDLGQSALDEAYFRFLEERQFPEQTLSEYSGFVYGNPMTRIPTQTTQSTGTPYQPSLGQTLLGVGSTLGAAALRNPNIFREGGGFIDRDRGLSGLPMFRRQVGGGVWEGVEDVEIETVAEETPEENPRTAIFKQLAAKAGPFPAHQTPDELTAAGEAKKARRMAVFDKIIGEKGQLKFGDVMIAVGQGLMAGGGMAYSKAFEDLTKKLQKERGDISQLQAQQLISNLEIDELTDEQIRVLPRELALYVAGLKKAERKARLEEAEIAEKKAKAKSHGGVRGKPTTISSDVKKGYKKLRDVVVKKHLSGPEFKNIRKTIEDTDPTYLAMKVEDILNRKGETRSREKVTLDVLVEIAGEGGIPEEGWWEGLDLNPFD